MAAAIWADICGIKLKKPTIGIFFLGLATFMLQVAPAWFDVGSDWVAGRWGIRCRGHTTCRDMVWYRVHRAYHM